MHPQRQARRPVPLNSSKKPLQDQRLKSIHPFKHRVVSDQAGCMAGRGGRGMQPIRSFQAMKSAKTRRKIGAARQTSNRRMMGFGFLKDNHAVSADNDDQLLCEGRFKKEE